MAIQLPRPPHSSVTDLNSPAWQRWFQDVARKLTTVAAIAWSSLDFMGSNLTDLATRNHNDLQSPQGGTLLEYYHLTSAEYTGSGTGVFARTTSPVFTTPNIGYATGDISGNAATVTNGAYTNAANSFSLINPLTTIAESWIGPSSTTGVYFKGGNVGLGTTSPTAYLHLKAGTAIANTAPLKLTSGTLNTTAEAGSIEFLLDRLYATVTTNAIRKQIVTSTSGRVTAQTTANASVVAYTIGAADASFEVSANILVTTSSAEAFTVTCAYTDEGNTARTLTLSFLHLAPDWPTATIGFANGAVPYSGIPAHIRCKASTTITIATIGTFTGATYNAEAVIKQTA